MKKKQNKKILAVRGTALIINSLDRIDGPAEVYIVPDDIAICDQGFLKLYRRAKCITLRETETTSDRFSVEDYTIPIVITEDGDYEIDLQDSYELFVQYTQAEFAELPEEDWLLFEFGKVRTQTVHSQIDVYSRQSFSSLINELTILVENIDTPATKLEGITEIICKKCFTIKSKYLLQDKKDIIEYLFDTVIQRGESPIVKSCISDIQMSITDRLEELRRDSLSEVEKLQEKIDTLQEEEYSAVNGGNFNLAAEKRDEGNKTKQILSNILKNNKANNAFTTNNISKKNKKT